MKEWWNKKYAIIAFYAFLVIAAAILFNILLTSVPWFLIVCSKFLKFVESFIIGFIIAYLLNPSYTWFRERVYKKLIKNSKLGNLIKILSIFTVYLVAFSLLAFLLYIVIPQFVSGINRFVNNFNDYYNSFNELINKFANTNDTFNAVINESANKFMEYLKDIQISDFAQLKNITESISSIIKSIFSFFIGVVISIYMLYNKELFSAQIKKIGYAIFSKKFMTKLQRLFGTSDVTFSQYITGVLIDALIVGCVCFIAMRIANVPYAILIGVIIGITNMIPFFGPFIGGVPSVLLVLMVQPSSAIWSIVIILLLQFVDGNFIAPKISGQKTGLSAIWVIFAIVVGGGFFGLFGMLVAVPIFSITYNIIKNILNRRLEQKSLSPDTNDYLNKIK